MSIAPTLQRYLTAENVQYDVIPHDPTVSSTRTAEACRISGDRLAKAIVLRRNAGYMLAVLPASHHLRLSFSRVKRLPQRPYGTSWKDTSSLHSQNNPLTNVWPS
jgi:Ala-tRNA(Pro) deacylase